MYSLFNSRTRSSNGQDLIISCFIILLIRKYGNWETAGHFRIDNYNRRIGLDVFQQTIGMDWEFARGFPVECR